MRTLPHLLRTPLLAALVVALLVGFAGAQQPRGNAPRSSPRQAPKAGGETNPNSKSGRAQPKPKASRPAPAAEESSDEEQPLGPLEGVEADAQSCRTAAEAVQVYRIFLATPKLPADVRKAAEKRLAEWVAMEKQEMRRLGKKWITQQEYEATTKKVENMIAHSFELLKLHNYKMAEKELIAASRLNPESGKAEFVMGFVWSLVADNDAKAAVHFAEAVKREPNNAYAYNNLGYIYAEQGRFDAAITMLERAVAIKSDYGQAYYNLGLVHSRRNHLEQAIHAYRTALRIDPQDVYAHNNLGLLLVRAGRLEEAMHEFRAALEVDANDLYAHNNLGKVYERTQRLDEARAEFEWALLIDPRDAYARNNLGRVLAKLERFDEAITQFNLVLAHTPDDAVAFHNLGQVYAQKNAWQAAVEHYKKALALSPRDAYARNNLGRAFLALGRLVEADTEFRASLHLNPRRSSACPARVRGHRWRHCRVAGPAGGCRAHGRRHSGGAGGGARVHRCLRARHHRPGIRGQEHHQGQHAGAQQLACDQRGSLALWQLVGHGHGHLQRMGVQRQQLDQ
ncbi:MAG: tetratricopeptide repeat protein, partial [Planctomycetes bacterium]|nr:tetratricopeptide repeat protein [Planctomycetota bacterium]